MHDGTATVFDFPNRIAAQAGSGDLLAGYIAGNLLQINDYYDAIFMSIMRFYCELEKFADRNCYLPDELILNLSFSEKQKIRV
jgi:NAD(P)H-hydrate repair Nnr-like enzyme with NAD(P)H-hydrate dehydratase domain